MAGGLTAAGAKKLADHISLFAAYSIPSLWAGLTTAQSATSQTELTSGGMTNYLRSNQALTGSNWGAVGVTGNYYQSIYGTAVIDFGTSTGGSGTVTGVMLSDASSAGNNLWWETLGTSITMTTGTHITIAAGVLTAGITTFGNGGAANSGLSNTYCSGAVGHMIGKTALTQPGGVYVALCTANCTATALGTEGTVYTGYGTTRPAAGCAAASLASPAVANPASLITFGAYTSGSPVVIAFGLMDNATVGSGTYIGGGTITSTTISATPTIATSQPILSIA